MMLANGVGPDTLREEVATRGSGKLQIGGVHNGKRRYWVLGQSGRVQDHGPAGKMTLRLCVNSAALAEIGERPLKINANG